MKDPAIPSPKERFYQDEALAKKTIDKIMSDMTTIDLLTESQKSELFDTLLGLWHSGWKAGHAHHWRTTIQRSSLKIRTFQRLCEKA